MTQHFPPFELQGSRDTLASLASDICGMLPRGFDTHITSLWLAGKNGNFRLLSVAQRDLAPRYEVFGLGLDTLQELEAQCNAWTPPTLPDDMPELLRAAMSARPVVPTVPDTVDPWPFAQWRTQVIRRADYVIPAADSFPECIQPMSVPSNAIEACEVAEGILFTGLDGQRLMIAAAVMPFDLIVTRDADEIDAVCRWCELIDLTDYLERYLPEG